MAIRHDLENHFPQLKRTPRLKNKTRGPVGTDTEPLQSIWLDGEKQSAEDCVVASICGAKEKRKAKKERSCIFAAMYIKSL